MGKERMRPYVCVHVRCFSCLMSVHVRCTLLHIVLDLPLCIESGYVDVPSVLVCIWNCFSLMPLTSPFGCITGFRQHRSQPLSVDVMGAVPWWSCCRRDTKVSNGNALDFALRIRLKRMHLRRMLSCVHVVFHVCCSWPPRLCVLGAYTRLSCSFLFAFFSYVSCCPGCLLVDLLVDCCCNGHNSMICHGSSFGITYTRSASSF